MDSKARESNTLSGFTLDVADNSDQNKDAQWIAIGAWYSGEKYQTIEQISLSHLQIFAVRQRYLSEEAELVHGMETMQM